MSQPLLAVDTPSMLFRAFYALPKSIVGPDGNPVNALLGAANLIVREVEAHDPRAVVLCFGPDAASYRTELFPDYHADRDDVPDAVARGLRSRDPRAGGDGDLGGPDTWCGGRLAEAGDLLDGPVLGLAPDVAALGGHLRLVRQAQHAALAVREPVAIRGEGGTA